MRITLSWRAPASTVPPGTYRYRLFEKIAFDSDGRRVNLMEGTTSFTTETGIHTVDPPARYYLEVRAEYAEGNSRWARIEGLIGLSCATDPAPLAPDLWFQSTTSNDRLPETLYNGVPGALGGSALSRVPEIHWQYPGSGTRPDYIALYGDRLFQIAPPVAGQIQGLTLDDPSSGSIHTRLLTAPATAAEGRRLVAGGGTDRHPGIRAVYGMRAVSKCGIATYRWSPLVLKDVMKRSTESSSPTVIQPIPRPTDVTPDGTVAGTHHFQVTFAGHESIHAGRGNIGAWHEFLIAGWQKDRYGNPVPVRYYAFRAAGTVSSLSQLGQRPVGGTSGRPRFRLIPNTNAFTLVVTGIPTDFDGWYSFSVRYAETLNYGNSVGTSLSPSYSDWQNIRFQERGTFVAPPEPSVGAVTGLGGNPSPQSCTTYEFSWTAPLANPAQNVLSATGYAWTITGATSRTGTTLVNRASVPTLNVGQHLISVIAFHQTENRYVPSAPVTFPFFVVENCPCVILPPSNGRQIESGISGVAIVQFDRPARGANPIRYTWTLTGPSDNSEVASTERTGNITPNASGGVFRQGDLAIGAYSLDVKSVGCDPAVPSTISLVVAVDVRVASRQPFPPDNLAAEEGAERSTWTSRWNAPGQGPRPTSYEYKIEGRTFQTARSTVGFTATHSNLNTGDHVVSVRSLIATPPGADPTPPSDWARFPFKVRAAGCNPPTSLEEGVGGTQAAPIWNARKLFWAAPLAGGMAPTGYSWELWAGATQLRNGTTTATVRRVDLFNLEELPNNQSYRFTVYTDCASGPSEGVSVGFRAVCPEPEPPQQLEAVGTGLLDSQVWTMRWIAPATGATSGQATGYTWELQGPENRNSGTEPISVDTLSTVFTDLPKGVYRFGIRSTGDCDKESTQIAVTFEVGKKTKCGDPIILRKQVGVIWSTWTVSWRPPSAGDTPIRYDWRMVGPTQPSGSVQPSTIDRDGTTYNLAGTVTIDNLKPGTYTFFVQTVCDLNPTPPDTGMSPDPGPSIEIRVTERAPREPRNVMVEAVRSSITFEGGDADCPPEPSYVGNWDAPIAGTAPSNYDWELYKGATRVQPSRPGAAPNVLPALTTRAVLGRLTPGDYEFKVRSRTGNQSSGYVGHGFTVQPQPCPTPILGQRNSSVFRGVESQVYIWDPGPCGIAPDSYAWRLRAVGAGTDFASGTAGKDARRAQLTGGSNGTRYTFYVRQVTGTRGDCLEAQDTFTWGEGLVIPPPDNVQSFDLTSGGDSVYFRWDVPEDLPSGVTITRYNWQMSGPSGYTATSGDVAASANLANRRVSFAALPRGTYTFRVRTDTRTSTATAADSAVGGNVSVWVEEQHTVVGQSLQPPVIRRAVRTTLSGQTGWSVEWEANPSGVRPSGYTWRWREKDKSPATDDAGPTATVNTSAAWTGGVTGKTYIFYVKATRTGYEDSDEAEREIVWDDRVTILPPESLRAFRETEIGDSVYFRWDAPDTSTVPGHPIINRYNWTLSGVGPTQSGFVLSSRPLRASFSRLAAGTYSFSVRTDTRNFQSETADSGVGGNVSRWISTGHTVSALYPPVDVGATQTIALGVETWAVRWSPDSRGTRPTGYAWRWREKGTATDIGSGTTGTAQSARTATLSGGTNGKTYEFLVKATVGAVESEESLHEIEWGEGTKVPPPEGLAAFRLTTDGASVYFRWDAPSGDLPAGKTLRQYNWELSGVGTGSGDVASGSTLRVSLVGLAAGTHAFRVRTDTRASSSETADSGYGGNVSDWVTVNHNVTGLSCAPPNLRIVNTETPIATGGSRLSRAIEWGASSDTAVTRYQWSGNWTQAPTSGSTSTTPRSVSVDHLPVRSLAYTITVHGVKNGVSCGSTSLDFNISEQDVEPPENTEVVQTNIASQGATIAKWQHRAQWSPPSRGKRPTAYQVDLYSEGRELQTHPKRSTDRYHDFEDLADGDYEVQYYTLAGTDISEKVTTSFTQPPEEDLNPPKNLKVTPGTGVTWQDARAEWQQPDGAIPEKYGYSLSGGSIATGSQDGQGETSSTSHSFTSLGSGSYTLEVVSKKEGLQDSLPATATFEIAEPVPDRVTGAKCSPGNSRTQKVVSWTAPTGTTKAEEYNVRTTGATKTSQTVMNPTVTLDLATGKTTVRITAVAKRDSGDLHSAEVSVECTVEPAPCRPPRNLKLTQSTANKLNWTAAWETPDNDDGQLPAITGYKWTLSGAVSREGETGANVRSVPLNNLQVGDFTFAVRMVSANCESDLVEREFTIEEDPLDPPTALMVAQDESTPAPRDVTVSWSAPSENRTPTGYEIRLTGAQTVSAMPVSGTSHTFSQLAEGSYNVYVRSVAGDDKGTEEASESFDVDNESALPSEPLAVSHSLGTDGTSVTYTWAPPTDNADMLTGYEWTQSGATSASGTTDGRTTTVQQSGLKIGGKYTFAVAAQNAAGAGPEASINFTAEVPPSRPNPVEGLSHQLAVAEAAGASTVDVTLSWMPPSEGDDPTHYKARISGGESEKNRDNISDTSVTFLGIGTGDRTAAVWAVNDEGQSEPATITFKSTACFPPNAVTNLKAELDVRIVTSGIVASWNKPAVDDMHRSATDYLVKWVGSNDEQSQITSSTTYTFSVDRGLLSGLLGALGGVGGTVTVTAQNVCGDSDPVSVSVGTENARPGTPEGLTVSASGLGLSINWSPPSEGGEAESYIVGVTEGSLHSGQSETQETHMQVQFGDIRNRYISVNVWAKNEYGTSETPAQASEYIEVGNEGYTTGGTPRLEAPPPPILRPGNVGGRPSIFTDIIFLP